MKTFCFIIGLLVIGGSAFAQSGISRKTLLEQALAPATVEDIRIDEITCAPGQGAPAHYHPCEGIRVCDIRGDRIPGNRPGARYTQGRR